MGAQTTTHNKQKKKHNNTTRTTMENKKKELTPEQYVQKLHEVSERTYMDQAKFFLNAYIKEFLGRFDDVLNFVTSFARLDPRGLEGNELDEFQSHRFLEMQGEAKTVVELRQKLSTIDVDVNNKMALIEFLLFRFNKTIKELIDLPQNSSIELLRAIEEFNRVVAERVAREKRMDTLRAESNESGVRGMRAKAELAQMESQDTMNQRRQEITAAAKTRRLQREPGAGGAERELEDIQRRKQEEEAQIRAESRMKLAAKAALWNKNSAATVINEVKQAADNVRLNHIESPKLENPFLAQQRVLGTIRRKPSLKAVRKPSEDLTDAVRQAFVVDRQRKNSGVPEEQLE
eukprot:GILK01000004.1.p1 GENE.GILK01000004.1~~GILK01000004.1.p1  ORF type:complete len:347 (-),score=104.49 GILK01000004.1:114-1154(-)